MQSITSRTAKSHPSRHHELRIANGGTLYSSSTSIPDAVFPSDLVLPQFLAVLQQFIMLSNVIFRSAVQVLLLEVGLGSLLSAVRSSPRGLVRVRHTYTITS